MYLRAFTPIKLSEQGFATEGDRAFYSSFDRNQDGMISFAEQNEFLRATGQPLMTVPITTQPAAQAAPVIPLALLAYLFLS